MHTGNPIPKWAGNQHESAPADTWTSTSDDPYLDLLCVYFLDANRGYVAGESNFMMKTINGGNSWSQYQSNRPLKKMQFIDELTGYAISFGELVKTTNGGTIWNPVGMEDCISYCFSNPITVFGVGRSGTLLKSEDSGATCTNYTISVSNANFLDVHFPDENTGFAVGYYIENNARYGNIVKTNDAGDTWELIFDDLSENLASVFFTDNNTGYISGGYGSIFKTADGGNSWDTLNTKVKRGLWDLVFVNENTGFVFGDNPGVILKTTNAGATWDSVYSISNWLRGIHFVDENIGYAITTTTILKTIDGGSNWTETALDPENIFLDVFFVNEQVGFICGFHNLLKNIRGQKILLVN